MQDEINAQHQDGNSKEWLKPWQFKPGRSGNPGGRPKGTVSLKHYAKRYLEELDDEGKMKFMEGLDKNEIWRMAEGNPETKSDITSDGKPLILPSILITKNDIDSQPRDSSTGQTPL